MIRIAAVATFLIAGCSTMPQYAGTCENAHAVLDADFAGARMSSCRAKKNSFVVTIDPEDKPINPSPWYAFRVSPKQSGDVDVTIKYSHSKHRYRPKRSANGEAWRLVEPARLREYRGGKRVALTLDGADAPFFVSAQEFLRGDEYASWTDTIAEQAGLTVTEIGRSVEGRPLHAITSAPTGDVGKKEHVLFVGRQHPPEITGGLAMLPFLETVFGDSDLATKFRTRFYITAVPLMNPDGVANGHWRHNMRGVDLNRNWGPFTEPETQSIKNILDEIDRDENAILRLLLDFHSTNRNVFYTQANDEPTVPEGFTLAWLARADERLDGYEYEHAERPLTDLATSKNYIYRRFGAPGITYELGDQTDRGLIRDSAIIFAEEMMETLLSYREE